MTYRPITDIWILARAKLKDGRKYYGAYPGGFLERARVIAGASIYEPVLHVCSGMVKHYPYKGGFGPHDKTLDHNPLTEPDYLQDARSELPSPRYWKAILIDPPYTLEDAVKYGASEMLNPNKLIKDAIDTVTIGNRVGILHYIWPRCPKNAKCIASIGVLVGYNNRIRCFSVYERIEVKDTAPLDSTCDGINEGSPEGV